MWTAILQSITECINSILKIFLNKASDKQVIDSKKAKDNIKDEDETKAFINRAIHSANSNPNKEILDKKALEELRRRISD